MSKWKSEWCNPGFCEGMDDTVLARMKQLRRCLLIHSYLYYGIDDTIWDDHKWDAAARELHALQKEHGWNIGFYDGIFKHWTGQSGYWLPTNKGVDQNIVRVALRQLEYFKKNRAENISEKTS